MSGRKLDALLAGRDAGGGSTIATEPIGWQIEGAREGWEQMEGTREEAQRITREFFGHPYYPTTGRIRPVYPGEPINVTAPDTEP